jgi:uncharacterized protein (DUF983 family)
MIGRALLRRCPWCGGRGAWFKGWFGKVDRCRTCGLQWDRQLVGFELGATSINVILTLGSILTTVLVGFILTMPDVAVLPIMFVALGMGVSMPLLAYPYTQTLWMAVDLLMRAPEDDELADWALASAAEPGTYPARARQR